MLKNLAMKAIRVDTFGGPKVLKLQEVNIPVITRTQVLVKCMSAGVNPVDTYIREGQFHDLPDLPYIPGKDGAGIVEKIGEQVTKFRKGQRVFCISKGSYAEYCVAEEQYTFPLDDRLSFDQGAAICIPYFTAYRSIFINGSAAPGETLLIHGASGAVGLAAVQLAKHFKMKVIGTAGSEEGMKIVKENGADQVYCHKDPNYLKEILASTKNVGVDIIVEMLANVNLAKDLDILNRRGRVMIVGCRGNVSISPRMMMFPETKIIGVALFSSTREEWDETTSGILKGIKDGYVSPIVSKTYALEEVQDAHRDVMKSKGAKGKLVLSIAKEHTTKIV